MPSQGGGAPEWVELLPAGPEVAGRDGRRWLFDDPETVAAASLDGSDSKKKEIPIDWEHATEIKAPQGEPAPAAGWITALEVRAFPSHPSQGALWGRVEWTERGREAVASREYRYLSPVFEYEKDTRRITRLLSAGLTNSPNLRMQALNQQGQEKEETTIDTLKQERDTARNHAEQVAKTIAKETAKKKSDFSSAAPSLDKFVPRADHDAALKRAEQRAENAEAALAEHRAQALEREIDAAINTALKAGKITPATADYHRAQCRPEGGLDRFTEYVKAAPAIAGDSGLDKKKPRGTEAAEALNTDQARIATMFGNSPEDLKKYGAAA